MGKKERLIIENIQNLLIVNSYESKADLVDNVYRNIYKYYEIDINLGYIKRIISKYPLKKMYMNNDKVNDNDNYNNYASSEINFLNYVDHTYNNNEDDKFKNNDFLINESYENYLKSFAD